MCPKYLLIADEKFLPPSAGGKPDGLLIPDPPSQQDSSRPMSNKARMPPIEKGSLTKEPRKAAYKGWNLATQSAGPVSESSGFTRLTFTINPDLVLDPSELKTIRMVFSNTVC